MSNLLTANGKGVRIVHDAPRHTNDPKRVREAAKQYAGQSERTIVMLAEMVIELTERVERLEAAKS